MIGTGAEQVQRLLTQAPPAIIEDIISREAARADPQLRCDIRDRLDYICNNRSAFIACGFSSDDYNTMPPQDSNRRWLAAIISTYSCSGLDLLPETMQELNRYCRHQRLA